MNAHCVGTVLVSSPLIRESQKHKEVLKVHTLYRNGYSYYQQLSGKVSRISLTKNVDQYSPTQCDRRMTWFARWVIRQITVVILCYPKGQERCEWLDLGEPMRRSSCSTTTVHAHDFITSELISADFRDRCKNCQLISEGIVCKELWVLCVLML